MNLNVAHVVERTEAEGPGARFAVWVQGCPIRCPGCCNPEMLPFDQGDEIDTADLAEWASRVKGIEGVTLLGGEPFAQAQACADFARRVREHGLTVMVFTGYRHAELEERRGAQKLLGLTDLLVDGPYDRRLPERTRRWIGSSNQNMRFLTDAYSPIDLRFYEGNTVEIRYRKGSVEVNGWPIWEPHK